jgi:hypothetical protein
MIVTAYFNVTSLSSFCLQLNFSPQFDAVGIMGSVHRIGY